MRTLRISSQQFSCITYAAAFVMLAVLCVVSPALTYFITGSLCLLITIIMLPLSHRTSGNCKSDLSFCEFACFCCITDLRYCVSSWCPTQKFDICIHFKIITKKSE